MTRWLRAIFCLLLILIVLPSGAVEASALHVCATLFFGVACLALIVTPIHRNVRGVYLVAFIIAVAIGAWIILQTVGFTGNPFANPIWGKIAHGSEFAAPISVAPGDTQEGLIAALLPFAIFLTVLVIFPTDEHALALIRFVVIFGSAACLVGLLQFLLFPDMLLFEPKRFYLESLTTVFVNRNTAATFVGMVMIFAVGLAFHHIRPIGSRLLHLVIGPPSVLSPVDVLPGLAYGAAAAVAFICLMLTQSRAGAAASLTGMTLMLLVLTFASGYAADASVQSSPKKSLLIRLLRALLVLAAIVIIALLFAGRAIVRAGIQGTTDVRFCFFPSIVRMAKENWLVGTGFGTFRDVFPAYRSPTCDITGVLDMAHDFYLEGWITLGLPFVIVAFVVVAGLVFIMAAGIRSRRRFRWIPAAGLATLVLQILHNGVDFSIQNPGVAAVFASLTGASVVIARGRRLKRTSARPPYDNAATNIAPAVETQAR